MAIQVIVNQAGPLPFSVQFESISDDTVYLEVNGTVFSPSANQMIGIGIFLNEQQIGEAQIYSNGENTHRAVVPAYIPLQLQAGQTYALGLYSLNGETIGDPNDFYTAVIHL